MVWAFSVNNHLAADAIYLTFKLSRNIIFIFTAVSHHIFHNCATTDVFQCEERGISLIQSTSLIEEAKNEQQRLAESMVNISYDEQRVDLNILRRSQQKQQRHSSCLKSSLKLPLSYQVKLQPKINYARRAI